MDAGSNIFTAASSAASCNEGQIQIKTLNPAHEPLRNAAAPKTLTLSSRHIQSGEQGGILSTSSSHHYGQPSLKCNRLHHRQRFFLVAFGQKTLGLGVGQAPFILKAQAHQQRQRIAVQIDALIDPAPKGIVFMQVAGFLPQLPFQRLLGDAQAKQRLALVLLIAENSCQIVLKRRFHKRGQLSN